MVECIIPQILLLLGETMGKVKNHNHNMISMATLFGGGNTKDGRAASLHRCNTCPYSRIQVDKSELAIKIEGVEL